jgi:hypothetical protein
MEVEIDMLHTLTWMGGDASSKNFNIWRPPDPPEIILKTLKIFLFIF